ncbi:MAG: YdiU family protein [Pseudomonadota bacterium]
MLLENCGFNFDTTYTKLPEEFFTLLNPEPVSAPELVVINNNLAADMGLDFANLTVKEQAELFSGNNLPTGATSFAQVYAGHQFGHFSILGDGRAHILGEHITPDNQRLDIQFKGSGRTPYSRRGDGRAALGPMLREYIISEAMYSLNIPTTRSLAVITTGDIVMREEPLKGAILTRVASSHIRIGTFEYIAAIAAQEDIECLKSLVDYTINRHYPEIKDNDNKVISLIETFIEQQSDLITNWLRVGFIHGVMNTDNVTLSGETIDYGPCAFMDAYDPATVFSSIDNMGRYAYANQPKIAQWNIARLAETLLPLLHPDINNAVAIAEEIIYKFQPIYQEKWFKMMCSKLGLTTAIQDDLKLINDLLNWMKNNYIDYTNFFRDIASENKPDGTIYNSREFNDWYNRWQQRLLQENYNNKQDYISLMNRNNPAIIPRNHNVEHALKAANEGNLQPFHQLLDVLQNPYHDDPYIDDETIIKYKSPPKTSERIFQTFCGT